MSSRKMFARSSTSIHRETNIKRHGVCQLPSVNNGCSFRRCLIDVINCINSLIYLLPPIYCSGWLFAAMHQSTVSTSPSTGTGHVTLTASLNVSHLIDAFVSTNPKWMQISMHQQPFLICGNDRLFWRFDTANRLVNYLFVSIKQSACLVSPQYHRRFHLYIDCDRILLWPIYGGSKLLFHYDFTLTNISLRHSKSFIGHN